MKSLKIVNANILFIILFSFSACIDNVSRDNPLDPAHGTSGLQLTGQVLTFYHPRNAIPNASILIQPENLIVISDENGFFKFNNINPGVYTVICQAEGYQIDSLSIDLRMSIEHTFLLDGLPTFEKTSLKAHHRSRWFPLEEIYFIEIEAEVSDLDGIGDIQSVRCEIPSMGFLDTLQAQTESGKFSSTIFDSDLPVASVHQLIGTQIYLIVEDDFGTKTSSEAKFITRIIEQTPRLLSPVELQPIEASIIDFQWERVSVPYPASLKIEIFQINLGIAYKVHEIKSMPINNTTLQYSHNLNHGDYFWTLNIVDEFGNSSSSREGTFQIKQN